MTDTRGQNETDALERAIRRIMANMRTSIPGRVESFNDTEQTLYVTPTIRKLQTLGDDRQFVQIPPIINVPLIYPHAQTAGFALTLPIQQGDMVQLIVCDRSIDFWAEFGEIQNFPQTTQVRTHDLTDSLAIVGATPLTMALGSYQTDSMELRNKDRSIRVNISNSAVDIVAGSAIANINSSGAVSITAPSNMTVTAPTATFSGDVSIGGNLTVGGDATVTGQVSADSYGTVGGGAFTIDGDLEVINGDITNEGVSVGSTHTHSGVTTGGDSTGGPN